MRNFYSVVPAPRLVCVELNPGPAPVSEDTRMRAVALYQNARWKVTRIAKELKIKVNTVKGIVAKYEETGSVKNRPGQGRKRLLTSKEVARVVKKAKSGKSAAEISRESARSRKKFSTDTARRRLKESGLQWLVVQKRETITPQQQAKRLSFAKKMLAFDWKNVLFTDEKTFQLSGGPYKKWQDPENRDEAPKTRHAPKIHVWAGIGYYWKTDLYVFDENLDGELYRKILRQRIPPRLSLDCPMKKRGNWVFLQDNDPKHTAKKTQQYLDEIAPDRIRDFPPNSPDFNVQEDAWSQLEQAIKKKNIPNVTALKKTLKKEWNNLSWDKMRGSIMSLPSRLEECISRDGQRTNY